MWFLLFAAFAIGLATGWWMRRGDETKAPAQTEAPLGTLDLDAPKSPEN
jgi:hypothetical protein